MGNLDGVVVPHHVIGKHHVSLPCEADPDSRAGKDGLVFEAPILPMSVGVEDTGMPGFAIANTACADTTVAFNVGAATDYYFRGLDQAELRSWATMTSPSIRFW